VLDDNVQPIPVTDVDYRSLKVQPTPEDYFLLSRINGKVTVAEICSISGQPRDVTHASLERLVEAGLIRVPAPEPVAASSPNFGAQAVPGSTPPPAQASPQPAPAEPAPAKPAPSAEPDDGEHDRWSGWPGDPSSHQADPELLAQGAELDDAFKREVVFMAAHLESVSYYELLGVPRDAGRKDIKGAYFKTSKRFHPDRFYGKDLGDLQGLVESVFQAVNKGYQTLSHKGKRAEYDGTLAPPSAASPAAAPAAPQASAAAARPAGPMDRKREMAFGVLLRQGEKHEEAREYAEAAAAYKKAFAIKPDAAVAMRGANLLRRLDGDEHIAEAVLMAKAAAKENPSEIKPLVLIGDIYEEHEDYADSLRYYEQAQALEPENKTVLKRIEFLKKLI
jgi:curved DNA-binding protein CbpA